jgi:type I restriction enzyme S subunit
MSEWKKVKLGEICSRVTSGGTPKATVESYYTPPTIPWLKTKEVNYCRIYETENYISEDGLVNSSAKLIAPNSVIIAMYGQGDTAGRVAINKIPLTTNQACCNLTIDENKADYEFVYYQLCTLYNKMVSLKAGAAQPNLNAQIIKNLEVLLPALSTQHRIATILSRYDTLIENYQKQIKLLEEAAQRLYKEWFVDLRFPGYENAKMVDGLPEGWERKKLGELVEFKRGKTITKKEAIEGNIPVVAGGLEPAYYCDKSNTTDRVITISGSGANAGFTRMYFEKVWASDCSYADTSVTQFLHFVFCFLRENKTIIDNMQKGAAQPHVYAKDINSLEALLPTKEIIDSFEIKASKVFDTIASLQTQIRLLTEARDRLLPKLMGGGDGVEKINVKTRIC